MFDLMSQKDACWMTSGAKGLEIFDYIPLNVVFMWISIEGSVYLDETTRCPASDEATMAGGSAINLMDEGRGDTTLDWADFRLLDSLKFRFVSNDIRLPLVSDYDVPVMTRMVIDMLWVIRNYENEMQGRCVATANVITNGLRTIAIHVVDSLP